MNASIECPSCGGPARHVPVDSKELIACPWCGTRYERVRAEQVLESLRAEVGEWLRRTAGVSVSGDAAASVDLETRSFLFNDRILPGVRRDVRRTVDEGIGDVLGSPMLVPPLLRSLQGYSGEDAVLVSRREEILGLRSLRARLEAPDVAAFATSQADRLALRSLEEEIDRSMIASHAAVALSGGIATGAELARTSLRHLAGDGEDGIIASAADPVWAALTRATRLRCATLLEAVDALCTDPVDADALLRCADRLDETAQSLLTLDARDFRTALASTGVHRDSIAVRVLAAVAQGLGGCGIRVLQTVDALTSIGSLLGSVRQSKDAAWLVHAWSQAIASMARGGSIPAVSDTSWVAAAIESSRQRGEQTGQTDVALVPFWAMPARHAKAEGFFFVSGRQYEGIALVPASAGESGTILAGSQEPMAAVVNHALQNLSRVTMPLDPPCVGPEAARQAAKGVLRSRDLRNVTLGEPRLVYLPIALVRYDSPRGSRSIALGPTGPIAIDPAALVARSNALREACGRAVG